MTSTAIVNTPIKPLLAFTLMGTAVLCFSLVDATAKWLTQGYDPWQIVFLSRIVPIAVALIVAGVGLFLYVRSKKNVTDLVMREAQEAER